MRSVVLLKPKFLLGQFLIYMYSFFEQIPEYCRTMDEAEILDNAFNLLFAFDEVVALGYRESVNLAQIR